MITRCGAAAAARFHLPGPGPYLLSHSVGAQPVAARAALEASLLGPWAAGGGDGWDAWLAAIEGFRGDLAALIGARPGQLCPQPSVTAAFLAWLSALAPAPGRDEIVMAAASFPSLGYAAQGLAQAGWRLRLIDDGADLTDPQVWADALDARTAVLLVTHVFSVSGALAPVAAIAAAARERGVRVGIDVAQSVGVMACDAAAWGADALIGSCVKWLCGGPGAGWLWLADPAALEPAQRGWFSHAAPFAMDIRDFRYAPDALRFWGGTPSIAPYVLARAGIAEIARIGVPAIRAHNRALQAEFTRRARPLLPAVRWPEGETGGTLSLDLGADRPRLAAALARCGARADFRGTRLRLSFHAYNTPDDIAALVAAIAG